MGRSTNYGRHKTGAQPWDPTIEAFVHNISAKLNVVGMLCDMAETIRNPSGSSNSQSPIVLADHAVGSPVCTPVLRLCKIVQLAGQMSPYASPPTTNAVQSVHDLGGKHRQKSGVSLEIRNTSSELYKHVGLGTF